MNWEVTNISIPPPTNSTGRIRVTVEGLITTKSNPDFFDTFCNNPTIPDLYEPKDCQNGAYGMADADFGPMGGQDDQLKVLVQLRRPDGTTGNVSLTPDSTNPAVATAAIISGTGGTLEVRRIGTYSGRWQYTYPDGTQTPEHHALDFYGSQTVTAELIGPLNAVARDRFISTGDTAWADADGSGGTLTNLQWLFNPWDTLPTPTVSGAIATVAACAGQTSCGHIPRASGRYYLFGDVDGIAFTYRPSEVIWVDRQPTLEVNCMPDPVVRGQPVACTATTDPEGASVSQVQWTFTTGPYEVNHVSGSSQWTGPAVIGGQVSVYADVEGTMRTANTSYQVGPRLWPTMNLVGIDAGHGDLANTPADYGDLAHTDVPTIGDLQTSARVSSGPNEGFWYLTSPIVTLCSWG